MAEQRVAFGERLRDLREAAGLTQVELAERAGLSANAISALERGDRRHPHLPTVRALAAALGLSESDRAALIAVARQTRETLFPDLGRWDALPIPLTPFVDREREVAEVTALLREGSLRLVTLTGPGGVGKTRLALRVAEVNGDAFATGSVFVGFGAVRDPSVVLSILAQQLGIPESGRHRSLAAHIAAVLGDREPLVLLDNLDHVTMAAPEIGQLLASCPHLYILATSRVPLRLAGEQVYPVEPLAVPDADQPLEEVATSPAVRLFVARARAARPDFALTSQNAAAVAATCTRLDGLPLAIELAAPRAAVMSPAALLARLEHRLVILADGPCDMPAWQQTLRGAIAWSNDLLTDEEQALFRALSVFAGSFSLDAAERVIGQAGMPAAVVADHRSPAVFDGIASLVAKSLVRTEPGDGEPRFRMLATIREYGLERLAASGETEALRQRHAAWCLALAEEAAPHLTSREHTAWMARLVPDRDNLRAALTWCQAADRTTGLRLAGALAWFWYRDGALTEGRTWLETFLTPEPATDQLSEATLARAKALAGAGRLAHVQGDAKAARPPLEAAVVVFRARGERHELAYALVDLSQLAYVRGDYLTALDLGQEAVALFRAEGDRWGLAHALQDLGPSALSTGDYAAARAMYEESFALQQAAGDSWAVALVQLGLGWVTMLQDDLAEAQRILEACQATFAELGERRLLAYALTRLGQLATRLGDLAVARERYLAALEIWRTFDQPFGLAGALSGLAAVAAARGEAERAARLGGAAAAMFDRAGAVQPAPDRAEIEPHFAAARARLGPARFAALWTTGQSLPAAAAVAEAMATTESVEPVAG